MHQHEGWCSEIRVRVMPVSDKSMDRGLKIVEEEVGGGAVADRGDTVIFDLEIALNKGEMY